MSEQFWISAYLLFGLCSVIIYEKINVLGFFLAGRYLVGAENSKFVLLFGFSYFCEFFFDLVASVNADMPMISPLTMSMGTAKTIVLL
jgi:hypothetical protein